MFEALWNILSLWRINQLFETMLCDADERRGRDEREREARERE